MYYSSRILGCAAVSCLIVFSPVTVVAQDASGGIPGAAVEDAHVEHVNYAYAQVLRVVPVYRDVQVARTGENCANPDGGQAAAESGRSAPARARGGMASVMLASFAAAPARPGSGGNEPAGESACPLPDEAVTVRQLEGYDVEYRYRGEVFVSRLDHDPGDRLRIRVAVTPAVESGTSGEPVWHGTSQSY